MGQSAGILPIHVKEGVKRGKSTSIFHFRKRQELGHGASGKSRTKNAPLGPVSGTHSQMSLSDLAHLHMRIVKIERVGQSARILPIHVTEGVKRGKSTSFFSFL